MMAGSTTQVLCIWLLAVSVFAAHANAVQVSDNAGFWSAIGAGQSDIQVTSSFTLMPPPSSLPNPVPINVDTTIWAASGPRPAINFQHQAAIISLQTGKLTFNNIELYDSHVTNPCGFIAAVTGSTVPTVELDNCYLIPTVCPSVWVSTGFLKLNPNAEGCVNSGTLTSARGQSYSPYGVNAAITWPKTPVMYGQGGFQLQMSNTKAFCEKAGQQAPASNACLQNQANLWLADTAVPKTTPSPISYCNCQAWQRIWGITMDPMEFDKRAPMPSNLDLASATALVNSMMQQLPC